LFASAGLTAQLNQKVQHAGSKMKPLLLQSIFWREIGGLDKRQLV
jgi:hypothetical protein